MNKVIIIGSGPSGITSGIYLARAGIASSIITNKQSSLQKADLIENYYGFPHPVKGEELYQNGIKQYLNLGGKIIADEIVGLDYEESLVAVGIKDKYPAEYIIIATGISHLMPHIKGLKEEDVSFCAMCDAFFYRGKNVAVIGAANYALHEAQILARVAKSVTLLGNGHEIKNAPFRTISSTVKEIKKEENGFLVEFSGEDALRVDGIFVAYKTAGATALAKKIGAAIKDDHIAVDDAMQTSIPGLYAIGDAAGGIKQITKATYDGLIAAYSIMKKVKGK